MEKLTFNQLKENTSWKEAVVVFTKDSFKEEYSEESRSYKISSDAKYFDGSKIGNSLFGECLDGTDSGVRLDWYMKALPEETTRWVVDFCYITEWEGEMPMIKRKSAERFVKEYRSEINHKLVTLMHNEFENNYFVETMTEFDYRKDSNLTLAQAEEIYKIESNNVGYISELTRRNCC